MVTGLDSDSDWVDDIDSGMVDGINSGVVGGIGSGVVDGIDSVLPDGIGSDLVDGNDICALFGEVSVGEDTASMVCRLTGSASILKRRPSEIPAEAGERSTSGR